MMEEKLTEGEKLRASTKSWLDYIDLRLMLFFMFFQPWKISVIRLIGTERHNCNEMVMYINRPYIRPISFSQTKVRDHQIVEQKGSRPKAIEPQFVGTLIYKHK